MKIVFLPATILILLIVSLSGLWLLLDGNACIIGGAYVVHGGETVEGDLNLIFAQAELQRGGRVDGRIRSFSSALDLNGAVAGDVLAIGSDIHVEETAELKSKPSEVVGFPYVILLPQIARVGTHVR